jgi:PepSY-associated transmembrane protein
MYPIFQKWHKKLGVCAALFVIFLASSGIILNHSQQINLNKKYIQSEWLLDLYQVKPAKDLLGYRSNDIWVTQVGGRLYFNEHEIAEDIKTLIGIVNINDVAVIAYDGQLTLVTEEGEIVEHLNGAVGVPAGMSALGKDEQENLIIKAAHGYYRVNLDKLDWHEFEYIDADFSKSSAVPEELMANLLKQYRGKGLTVERVLLDFHSGRVAGQWGVYVVDLIAMIFLILAISGVWMWWLRK